jgi:acetyltransferase-like isoleucine patch superfamily enzyme
MMPLTIVGNEAANHVHISAATRERCNGTIVLHGEGATFAMEDPIAGAYLYCTMSSDAEISIGHQCIYGNLTLHALDSGARIVIGNNVGLNGNVELGTHERATISVGDNCLFAGGVTVVASDIHHIYDIESGERINPARDISIGADVWVAAHSTVLKGTTIGNMSVVATCSVVTGSFPANCILGGVPAKVIRQGIRWQR